MNFLYHSVPKNIHGGILYPLNELKVRHPDVYETQASKYLGREHVMQQKIPTLKCLWNDVLHFTAVHPSEIKEALVEAGRNPNFTMSYYQVDPVLIDPGHATVYLYATSNNKNKMSEQDFAPYNPDEIAKFSSMPQVTKDYYKEMIGKGERPLLYVRIPHVLYRGSVDVTDIPIISV